MAPQSCTPWTLGQNDVAVSPDGLSSPYDPLLLAMTPSYVTHQVGDLCRYNIHGILKLTRFKFHIQRQYHDLIKGFTLWNIRVFKEVCKRQTDNTLIDMLLFCFVLKLDVIQWKLGITRSLNFFLLNEYNLILVFEHAFSIKDNLEYW